MNDFIKNLLKKTYSSGVFNFRRFSQGGPFRSRGNLPYDPQQESGVFRPGGNLPFVPENIEPEPEEVTQQQPQPQQQPEQAPPPVLQQPQKSDIDQFYKDIENYFSNNLDRLENFIDDAGFIEKVLEGPTPPERKSSEIFNGTMIPPDREIYRKMKMSREMLNVFFEVCSSKVGQKNVNLFFYAFTEKTKADIEYAETIERRKIQDALTVPSEEMEIKSRQTKESPKESDPYKTYKHYDDPKLSGVFFQKLNISKMTEQQIDSLSDLFKVDFKGFLKRKPEIFVDAADRMFGTPKSNNHFDQRINFFIKNPDLIPPISDNLKSILLQEAERVGLQVDVNNPISLLQDLQGGGRRKTRLIKILHNEIGPTLFGIMNDLINNGGNPLPDERILRWFGKGVVSEEMNSKKSKEIKLETPVGTEGEATLVDLLDPEKSQIAGMRKEKMQPEELKEVGRQIGAIINYSLSDTLKDMMAMKTITVDPLFSNTIKKFKNAYKDQDIDGMKLSIKEYSNAELLNAFCSRAFKQLPVLFHFPKSSVREEGSQILYENIFGRVAVPIEVLKDMFETINLSYDRLLSDKDDKYQRDIQSYVELVEDDLVDHPFNPKWGLMVNNKMVGDAVTNLVKLKKFIRKEMKISDVKSVEDIDDKSRGLISKIESDKDMREAFDLVAKNNPEGFIFMTLNQSQEDIDELDFSREQKDSVIPAGQRKDKAYHNLKTAVGDRWHVLLPNIINNVLSDPKYKDQSIKAFVSLFDFQQKKISNMGPEHRQVPSEFAQQGESYTDLYYMAIGEDPPPAIEDLSRFRKKYMKGKSQRGWWNKFFIEYDTFTAINSYIDINKERVKEIEEKKEAAAEPYRARAFGYSSEIRSSKNPLKKNKMLVGTFESNKIDPPKAGDSDDQKKHYNEAMNYENFVNFVNSWDGTSIENYYYYRLLGVKKALNLYDFDKEIDNIYKKPSRFIDDDGSEKKLNVRYWGINALVEEQKHVKKTLKSILEENGVDSSWISSLKIAYILYRRMKYSMNILVSSRKNMIKLSCNIDHINDLIMKVEEYYNNKISDVLK